MIRYVAARARGRRPALLLLSCLAAPLLLAHTVGAQTSVTTQHNDNARTGANLKETALNINSVKSNFGKLFELAVDGDIYAQPLYVSKTDVPTLGRNVAYVATMHNTVYAFDADQKGNGQALWSRSLEPAVQLAENIKDWWPDCGYDWAQNIALSLQKEVGIVGTPVISLDLQTLYLVTFTKEGGAREYKHYLHALDLGTGKDRVQRQQIITLSGFTSRLQNQRAGLLLANGIVYVAFGSYGDCGDFHGWVFGYDAKSLEWQSPAFMTTPGGGTQGGIWQAGQGPAADGAGNVYVISGNGDFGVRNNKIAVGNSFIKLTKSLVMTDWFTPWNAATLNESDVDLGSGGPLLLPDTLLPDKKLVIGGGKEGKLYLLDRNKMGKFCPTCKDPDGDTNIVQWFQATTEKCATWDQNKWPNDGCLDPAPAKNATKGYHHIHGSPVYWDGPGGPFIYVWGEADRLKRFRFDKATGKFETKPITSDVITPTRSMPGAMLSLSADEGKAGTGIIWAAHPTGCTCSPLTDVTCRETKSWCDANENVVPGTLRAIDASTLKELWNSEQDTGNKLGDVAKFTPVTVANGKVYVPTFSNKLVVYGPKP